MFQLVSDESSQKLGIEIHKKRVYNFEAGLLTGSASHDSTTRDFSVSVEPNYPLMAEIAEEKTGKLLRHEFDTARSHSIFLGSYSTLDVVDYAVRALEHWYKEVLKRKGANHRFLLEEGNSLHLVNDNAASDLRFGEAILKARTVQAFSMLRENKPMDYNTVVSKIIPTFLSALGLHEYKINHDLSKDGTGEVQFIIEEVGVLAFHKPLKEGGLAYMQRYGYANGDFYLSFEGEANSHVLKKCVFEWLIDAAKELREDRLDNLNFNFDETAIDVRRTYITRELKERESIVPTIIKPDTSNIVSLAAFRHS